MEWSTLRGRISAPLRARKSGGLPPDSLDPKGERRHELSPWSRLDSKCQSLLASAFKRIGKFHHSPKAPAWIFGQRLQHHLFNSRRNVYNTFLTESRRRIKHVLAGHLVKKAIERPSTAEPLVDDHTYRILVSVPARFPLQLFW